MTHKILNYASGNLIIKETTMLVNKNGVQVNPKTLPTGRSAREAVLANLREVHEPVRDHSKMFHISERAKLKS